MERPIVSQESLLAAFEQATTAVGRKLEKHGYGAYISSHEMSGILTEEYDEFKVAVHDNDIDQIKSELQDIVAAAVFSLASYIENETQLQAAQDDLQELVEAPGA